MIVMIKRFFGRVEKFIWLPILILILALGVLFYNYMTTGEIINKDIDLSGGKLLTITTTMTYSEVESIVAKHAPAYNIRTLKGKNMYIVELPQNVDEKPIIEELSPDDYSVREVGPAVSSIFWNQAKIAILVSFALMAIVVFFLFKSFVPSGAVILSAVSDVIITTAILSVLGIKLSIAIIGALLMLIGYSVDTDVLLTTKVLKSSKSMAERIYEAFKTGIMTSGTSFAALLVMYLMTSSPVIRQISITLIIGLAVDVINTWLLNAAIIKNWVKKKWSQ